MNLFRVSKTPKDLSPSDWIDLINSRIIGRNAMRDRDILIESLLNGRTYTWIAEKWGLSVRQIARIVPKRTKQIFKGK